MATVVRKTYHEMMAEFHAATRLLAEDAWKRYMRNVNQSLYLAGRKRAGLDTLNPHAAIWAELSIMEESALDDAEDWWPVGPKALSRAATVDMLADDIRTMLRNEPLYIFAD